MEQNKNDIQLGRFISLILRHKPETIGITLDKNGWANVDELLNGINKAGQYIDIVILKRIVQDNNKKRYSFNDNHTKIRANQGHSIDVDVELKEQIPPNKLYHGTSDKFLDNIMNEGLKPQNRQHVHLSVDLETAINVGSRHGKPIILEIDTNKMIKDGYIFWISKNEVWLSKFIPKQYIKRKSF